MTSFATQSNIDMGGPGLLGSDVSGASRRKSKRITIGAGLTLSAGVLSNSLDLSGYVPYTGATTNVNLGSNGLTVGAITASGLITASVGLESNTYVISNTGRFFSRNNSSQGYILGASDDCNMNRIGAGIIGFGTGATGSTAAEIRCGAITASGNVGIQTSSDSLTAFRVRNAAGVAIAQVDTSGRNFIAGGDAFAVRTGTGGTYLFNGGFLAVTNSTDASSATADTFLSRASAGVWRFGTTSAGTDAGIQCGAITASGVIACAPNNFDAALTVGGVVDTGIFNYGSRSLNICGTMNVVAPSVAARVLVRSDCTIGWNTNTNLASPSTTTNISQSSAGILRIGTTTANASGSLLLTNLTASGYVSAGASANMVTVCDHNFASRMVASNPNSGSIVDVCSNTGHTGRLQSWTRAGTIVAAIENTGGLTCAAITASGTVLSTPTAIATSGMAFGIVENGIEKFGYRYGAGSTGELVVNALAPHSQSVIIRPRSSISGASVILSGGIRFRDLNDAANADIITGVITAAGGTFSNNVTITNGSLLLQNNSLYFGTYAVHLRGSTDVLEINNGTTGQYRDLLVRGVTASGQVTGSSFRVASGALETYSGSTRLQYQSTTFTFIDSGRLDLGTGTGQIRLGGTGASHAGIYNSGTTTRFRTADDSADAPITCGALTTSGTFSFPDGTIDARTSMNHALTLRATGAANAIRVLDSGGATKWSVDSTGSMTIGTLGYLSFPHSTTIGDPNQIITGGGTGIGIRTSGSLFIATGGSASTFIVSSTGAVTASGAIQETPTQSAVDPTTTDIPTGKRMGWYNSTSGEFRDWVNIGGTLKKSAAYT